MAKLTLNKILVLLYVLVSALAIYAWGGQLSWNTAFLNAYTIFPLFGLLAFSLMWVHYVSGFIRDKWFPGQSTKFTFAITSYLVLLLVVLHPLLLIAKLNIDGYGLPPDSYKNYVGESRVIWVMLGTLGFTGLLLFELRRWFGKKHWWKYMSVFNDVAVLLIAFHSVKLGSNLQAGWFRYVWYFYIVTIVLCIGRAFLKKHKSTS